MVIYNLIGVPFPYNHPLFANDKRLSHIAKQLEDFIEISHDLGDIKRLLQSAELLTRRSPVDTPFDPMSVNTVCDALIAQAVMLYGKIFAETKGRTRLEAKDVFGSIEEEVRQSHDWVIQFRNKQFAHEEYRLNKHQLFVFPKSACSGKTVANSNAQIKRIVLHSSFEWGRLSAVAQHLHDYTDKKIQKLEETFSKAITTEQQQYLVDRQEYIHESYELQRLCGAY